MSSGAEQSNRGSNNGKATPGLKVVGNQAKKQDESVTRQGTQKMKFIPTLPSRRKEAEPEVKQAQPEEPAKRPDKTHRGRGRGRGRGAARGAGPRPDTQMVASGPFAMGPSMSGSKKSAIRATYAAPRVEAKDPSGSTNVPASDDKGAISKGKEKAVKAEELEDDIELYSDPDEGVQIVDMNAIRTMDWMAPENLRHDKLKNKRKEALEKIAEGTEIKRELKETKNASNALNLSESEEDEEDEDLLEHFATENGVENDEISHQEKLYFFQFPPNFAHFKAPDDEKEIEATMIIDKPDPALDTLDTKSSLVKEKKIAFAPDVKPEAPVGSTSVSGDIQEKTVDGLIGQLEVHRSGLIKLRLSNGMLLDVTAATQPSFFQHAVHLDPEEKKLCVLGEVNRRFVVSPDVDKLLEDLNVANNSPKKDVMDTS